MRIAAVSLLATTVLALPGCSSSGTYASQGASRGAAAGAYYGAFSAVFLGLVFGDGNVLASAVGGAAVGGVAGAAIGGSRGSALDQQIAQYEASAAAQRQAYEEQKYEEVKAEKGKLAEAVGPNVAEAVFLIVDCEHGEARKYLKAAANSKEPAYRIASVWAECLMAEDIGDQSLASTFYPELTRIDPEIPDDLKAQLESKRLLSRLRQARIDLGRPAYCR